MPCSKLIPVALVAVCLAAPASAHAQRRSGGATVGRAAPRGSVGRPVVVGPGRVGVGTYYRPYYRPYYYPYRFYPGLSFGIGLGYPWYGYYPYGYPYYSAYGYGYPGYVYPGGYAYPSESGRGWGGVRIQDAPRDAQVFADGYYVGIVDDFDGVGQHLTLEAGPHQIEIRVPGQAPRTFDVNIVAGQTINYHAR